MPGLAPIFAALKRARLVGGCVRDMLAGRDIADIDLATPDAPEAMQAALEASGLRVIPTGLAHGTVTAISAGRPFEITTLRRDEETDGRHARVAWTDDFQQDAARRDFTINAMSLDQAGTLHDYFGGKADLAAGIVRFVGDAQRRVTEDYLRILRFFRFFARYGFAPADKDAVAAIQAGRARLNTLSAERVWSEFYRILAAPDPLGALVLMRELGVLAAILPEATAFCALERLVRAAAPADPLLRLESLVTGDTEYLADRLKLSNAERARLAALRQNPVPREADDDATLRRMLADTPAALLIDRVWLAGGPAEKLGRRLAGMAAPHFVLTGRDALALGATPGPHVGQALRNVRAWWMEGGCVASEEAMRDRLAQALDEARKDVRF
jgi:poly(A) polymerase/tRNA nucleotidyltransferase (CCA-adding enzyme)